MLKKLKLSTELVNSNIYHYRINSYSPITQFSELNMKSITTHLLHFLYCCLELLLYEVSFKILCAYFLPSPRLYT